MSTYAPRKRLRRRTIICRGLALLLAASFCYFLLSNGSPKAHASEIEDAIADLDTEVLSSPLGNAVEAVVEAARPASKWRTEPEQAPLDDDDDDGEYIPKSASPEAFKTAKKPNHPQQDKPLSLSDGDFSRALHHAVDLLPSESSRNGLLTPITDTGPALLRTLAARVRTYSRVFSAWEAVHPTAPGEQSIINRIRGLALGKPEIRDLIKGYDAVHSYINFFEMRLFPGSLAAYGSHMALHRSFAGKGIVLTAGNDHIPYLLTSITTFRKLGCHLPVEVMYLGDDDISEDLRYELEAMPGVVTRDLTQMVDDRGWSLAGWAAKPWAILMSSFREVLFIDADALFFTSPADLFESEEYTSTGALFFLDRNISPESKRGWLRTILPAPYSPKIKSSRLWTGASGHMQESGVIVVDKARHFVPLLLVCRLNGQDRDGDKEKGKQGMYDMVYGDKETFWLGWELAGSSEYAFHSGGAGVMGVINSTSPDVNGTEEEPIMPSNFTVCAPQLLHLDAEGRPLWFNGGIGKNKNSREGWELDSFQVYLKEPNYRVSMGENKMWQIHEANVCCLTAPEVSIFTDEEREVLGMILETAKAVDWE